MDHLHNDEGVKKMKGAVSPNGDFEFGPQLGPEREIACSLDFAAAPAPWVLTVLQKTAQKGPKTIG